VAHSLATSPSSSSLVLGPAGIFGGAVLLAGFFPFDWGAGFFELRLILFTAGSMAIVLAVHRRQTGIAPALALFGAVPALVANACYLGLVVLSIGTVRPFAGDSGLVFFAAGAALWVTDAAFGLVTLRLGVVARWGALAVAIGSVLVFTGMDRLGLTSSASPTIFEPLALTGGILTAIGWLLLGFDVTTGARASEAHP